MKYPSSFGIAQRLYAVVAVLVLALGGVAALSWIELREVQAEAQRTAQSRVPQLQRMAALELDVTRVSLQLRHAMLARTPQELAATLADIGDMRRHIEQTLKQYADELPTADSRERFAKVPPLAAHFWRTGEAAAAESLRQQAAQLVQAVGLFRLDGSGAAGRLADAAA